MKLLTEYDSNHNNSNDTHHDHHLKKKDENFRLHPFTEEYTKLCF